MRIRVASLLLVASLLWPFCWSLSFAQAPVIFKGIDASAVGFSPDGKWLAAAGNKPRKAGISEHIPMSGLVKVWEISSGKEVFHHAEDHWEATSLAFSPTAPLLAVGFNDRPRAQVVIEKDQITLIYDEKMPPVPVKIWNLKTSKEHRCLLHDEDRSSLDNIKSVSFSPDGKTLATANSKAHFWDLATGKKRFTISEPEWYHAAVVFSPGGKIVAVQRGKGGLTPDDVLKSDNAVEFWDVQAKKRTASFSVPDCSREVMAFSSDGQLFAFAADKAVCIYDLRQIKKIVNSFRAHLGIVQGTTGIDDVFCLAFSPDSKILFTSGYDSEAGQKRVAFWKAWEPSSGRLIRAQKAEPASVNCLAVSPDGQRLATGGLGAVRLWTLPKSFIGKE
jgi:WD40 repeat protein